MILCKESEDAHMTDTSYLYEYFVQKSPDDKTKIAIKEKRGEVKQDKEKTKSTEEKKHV
jgi:regulator of sirC expression with transglutaminase-like and TPR domain